MKNAPHTRPTRLGEKLQGIRAALGLSQNEILERLGFGGVLFRSNISQYERGVREPPLIVLLEYARLAGVWVDVLIDDKLDLPAKLPSALKHEGARGTAARRNKRS